MKKELQELFTQFDEEGFAPTIPTPNAEARAVEWEAAVIAEIEKLEETAAFSEKVGKEATARYFEQEKKLHDLQAKIERQENREDKELEKLIKKERFDAEKAAVETVCNVIDDTVGFGAYEYTDSIRKTYKLPPKYGY